MNTEKSSVETALGAGLDIERHMLPTAVHGTLRQEEFSIPACVFEPMPLHDPAQPQTIHDISSTRGDLGSIVVARNEATDLAINLLNVSTSQDIARCQLQRLAEVLPRHYLRAISLPGRGKSLPWPPSAVMDMCFSGSFTRAGEHIAHVLSDDQRVRDTQNIDVLAEGIGARAAISMAGHLGRKVRTLVLFDPPGSQTLTAEQYRDSLQREASHRQAYLATAKDIQLQQLHAAANKTANPRVKGLRRRLAEPAALRRQRLAEDLQAANLSNVVGRVVLLSPRSSEFNTPETAYESLRAAQLEHPSVAFEQYVFKGTHSFPALSSNALSVLYGLAINPQS